MKVWVVLDCVDHEGCDLLLVRLAAQAFPTFSNGRVIRPRAASSLCQPCRPDNRPRHRRPWYRR